MNEHVRVQGLSGLIRSIARRVEGDVDGLSRDALEQWADRLEELEQIAAVAATLIKGSGHSKVSARMIVDEGPFSTMRALLRKAGYLV